MIFSHKLTDTNIYIHLLYRIHENDAKTLDVAAHDFMEEYGRSK